MKSNPQNLYGSVLLVGHLKVMMPVITIVDDDSAGIAAIDANGNTGTVIVTSEVYNDVDLLANVSDVTGIGYTTFELMFGTLSEDLIIAPPTLRIEYDKEQLEVLRVFADINELNCPVESGMNERMQWSLKTWQNRTATRMLQLAIRAHHDRLPEDVHFSSITVALTYDQDEGVREKGDVVVDGNGEEIKAVVIVKIIDADSPTIVVDTQTVQTYEASADYNPAKHLDPGASYTVRLSQPPCDPVEICVSPEETPVEVIENGLLRIKRERQVT